MYFLVLFYHVTQIELKPFNPVSKFLCIKLVIMFAFWQGIIVALLGWFGVLNEDNINLGKNWTSEEEIGMSIFLPRPETSQKADVTASLFFPGTALQNLMICIEMLFVALAHSYAYGYETYKVP